MTYTRYHGTTCTVYVSVSEQFFPVRKINYYIVWIVTGDAVYASWYMKINEIIYFGFGKRGKIAKSVIIKFPCNLFYDYAHTRKEPVA
jgi:hypothetical protein